MLDVTWKTGVPVAQGRLLPTLEIGIEKETLYKLCHSTIARTDEKKIFCKRAKVAAQKAKEKGGELKRVGKCSGVGVGVARLEFFF